MRGSFANLFCTNLLKIFANQHLRPKVNCESAVNIVTFTYKFYRDIKMIKLSRPLLVCSALCLAVISGCATGPNCCQQNKPVAVSACGPTQTTCSGYVVPTAPSSVRLRAIGFGAPGNYMQYTPAQQKLMAMRAAQIDAYRNLAEQVQGFRITGNTTVSAFTVQNDTIRSYVDSYLRGARVVSTTSIADGNFQVEVEIDVTNQFTDCLANYNGCSTPQQQTGCAAAGCNLPMPAQNSF